MTRQQLTILDELRKVDSHPSADDVYEMVRRRLSQTSLGTVY
jgi:Fur family ferric uptake transcriptional regulator